MPTKRVIKQKQKQKQTTIVNINVAKAKAKSRAKKSGKKGGKGSVMMLPPPIYTSPIDRLTPAMYGSQGQQIQQQSLDQMLKNFLSNQEKQQTNTGFKSLGGEPQLRSTSSFILYDDSSDKSFRSLGSYPGSSSVSYNPKSYASGSGDPWPDNVSELTDSTNIPSPFNNEEHSYLKASEPDYEANAPQFSEKLKPEHSIYETIRQMEEGILREQYLINQSQKWVEDSYKNSPIKSSPSKTNIIPFDESSGSNQSLGSFPGMYGPRVPVNKSEQESYFEKYYD